MASLRVLALPVLMGGVLGWAGAAEKDGAGDEPEDILTLPPMQVKGVPTEEFGFRITGVLAIPGPSYVMIREVLPNTAAAKAGLRPGELVSKIDGKTTSLFTGAFKLNKMRQLHWTPPANGPKSLTFSLEVHAPGSTDVRTVTMVLPSPAPHWGGERWTAPAGRIPAVVPEAGPLASLTREVLDNGIWSVLQDESLLGAASRFAAPVLGYEWTVESPSGWHRIWVTRQRGKTEILLQRGANRFVTSPSGAMDKARCTGPKVDGKRIELSTEEIRARFQTELDFWLTKVGRVTGRWPFEALPGKETAAAGPAGGGPGTASAPLAASFLKLPVATAAQKELFFDAMGRIGSDEGGWAFTETSRSLADDRVTTVRFDPSKPPAESCTLLKVDGKDPKPDYLQQWRSEGHGVVAGLGELPALAEVVDLNEVRVFADEPTAVVFELPVKAANAEFPAEKFQARFRVNKTQRGFEDFSVRLREPLRVAGIAKVTDAGLEARFQTLDPACAPQPVMLKMGGGVRVLFVKVSRSFEVTRTDFQRMVPYQP